MPAGDGYAINHGGPVVDVRLVGRHVERQHVDCVVRSGAVSGEDKVCGVEGVVLFDVSRNHGAVNHAVGLVVDDFALVNGCLLALETAVELYA